MPTEAELGQALVNADAAGNAPDARMLATALQNMRSSSASDTTASAPRSGIVANTGAGINEAVAGIVGAPVDAVNWGLNKGREAINAVAGTDLQPEEHPFGGSETIKQAMGLIGANPEDVTATTTGERVARSIGSGAASAALPAAGAEAALLRTWAEGDSLGRATMELLRGSGIASTTSIGAASGAGSELADESAPENYKSTARLIGGTIGGVGAAGGMALGEAAGSVARRSFQAVAEPAEVRAARMILSKASDPDTFRQSLDEGAAGVVSRGEEGEANLTGSAPTTFQATGDLGVGALERGVASSPQGLAAFAARREQQNAARLGALRDLADPDASSDAVTDYVKGRLQDLTVQHAGRVAQASDDLADALMKAGGENFDNQAAYGDALRVPLNALHREAKAETNGLWRAIDPDMSVPVSTAPLKQAMTDLTGDIPSIAKQPEGEEASILSGIGKMGQTASFGDMVALRSRLTDAIMAERRSAQGSPTVLRRLAITLDSVDNTLVGEAGEIASQPDQKMSMLDRLQAEARAFQEVRKTDAGRQQQSARGDAGFGDGADEPAGQSAIPSATGSENAAGGTSGGNAGNTGLSPTGGIPDDVAERYAAARSSTASDKQTFTRGPVGTVLRPGPTAGSFAMPASNVPKNLFDRPEALTAFVKAAGDSPDLVNQMQDYAAFSLRKAAVKDGELDPAKYQKWVDDHGYALRQFPDVADNFSTAAMAQDSLDSALANQKAALTDFQTSAARHFLDDHDPIQAVGKAITNPGQFAKLVAPMREDPAAFAGMRRATVEYMLNKTLSTAEAGTSGEKQIKADALQKFISDNRLALSTLFNADQRASMEAVAGDLQRANRSIVAARMPGTSGTTADTAMMPKNDGSMLQRLIWQAAGTIGGSVAGHPIAGFSIGTVAPALRAARMDSVNEALVELMLDPRKAEAAITKIPAGSEDSTAQDFARRIRVLTSNELLTESIRTGNVDRK